MNGFLVISQPSPTDSVSNSCLTDAQTSGTFLIMREDEPRIHFWCSVLWGKLPSHLFWEERGTYFDYFIFILIKWQVSILMLCNLSSCVWEAMGWNRPAREGGRRCHLVPGWSRMWVNIALQSPFTSCINERVSSPLMVTARLRASVSWGLLHKTGQMREVVRTAGYSRGPWAVPAGGPCMCEVEICSFLKWQRKIASAS